MILFLKFENGMSVKLKIIHISSDSVSEPEDTTNLQSRLFLSSFMREFTQSCNLTISWLVLEEESII
jgi:hypothetical protein